MLASPIVAIVSAFNEQDIIGQVVRDLIAQRLSVYFLDNGSTDHTVSEVARFVGRGVIGLEKFPADGDAGTGLYEWERILRRKEELSQQLDARWFIHHDADEFREGPWEGLDLAASIEKVDRFGYNAIDFELLNFWPTHDDFHAGDDVRASFVYYELGEEWNKIQIRCWKKGAYSVDLVSTGGHEAIFPGRKIFPLRFLLRHYPIRGQAHGMRKVFEERFPRFTPDERARGWHVQYGRFEAERSFLRNPASMTRYDPELARLRVLVQHRGVEECETEDGVRQRLADQTKRYQARLDEELDRCNRRARDLEQSLDTSNRRLAVVEQQLDTASHTLLAREADVAARDRDLDRRNRALADVEAALHLRNLDLMALHEQVDARNRELEGLSADLRQRDSELTALHRNLDDRNRHPALHEQLDARNQAVEALNATLHQRNLDLDALHRNLHERNRDLALHDQLDARNHAVEALHEQLDALNHEVESLHEQCAAQSREMEALHQQLDARNHEAESLHEQLDARNHEVAALHEQLDARNHAIETLNGDAHQRNLQIATVQRSLDDRNRHVEQVDADAANLRSQLDAANRELATTQAALRACAEELQSLRAELQEIHTSPLWRLPGLLRRRKARGFTVR